MDSKLDVVSIDHLKYQYFSVVAVGSSRLVHSHCGVLCVLNRGATNLDFNTIFTAKNKSNVNPNFATSGLSKNIDDFLE